ncbi:MAG: hemerythrin [Rhodoferax sp.]|nr:hemerythrin [Rhodoferax sp.]
MAQELAWNETLALGLDYMDDTHREFVERLAQTEQAPDPDLLPLWDDVLAHTRWHFGREDDWMRDTGFAHGNCHAVQHEVVLKIMDEIQRRGRAGELSLVRDMCGELGTWFAQHAQTMDAALAMHLRGAGYDPTTRSALYPRDPASAPIQGCGGACSSGIPATDPASAIA